MQDNVQETIQIAAQLAGTIQVQAAEIAVHSSNIAMAVIGLGNINASTKVFAHMAQPNAHLTSIKHAAQAVLGQIQELMQMAMAQMRNAVIPYAIIHPAFLIQQKQ